MTELEFGHVDSTHTIDYRFRHLPNIDYRVTISNRILLDDDQPNDDLMFDSEFAYLVA
jgi:hypothetical protein